VLFPFSVDAVAAANDVDASINVNKEIVNNSVAKAT
jgi:hypothetical protein